MAEISDTSLWKRIFERRQSKFIVLLVCFMFFSNMWLQMPVNYNSSVITEAVNNIGKEVQYYEVYKTELYLSNDMKKILLWTRKDFYPLDFGTGPSAFIENKCAHTNCYVTTDSSFLKDITHFDAIVFNGRNILRTRVPKKRSPHQKYIFLMSESSANYPICNHAFDNFFNWTATYRLDSDIPLLSMQIKDSKGNHIGPKKNMDLVKSDEEIPEELKQKIGNKTKMAAWIVSQCRTRNHRENYVFALHRTLRNAYNSGVDVFGNCTGWPCSTDKEECEKMLERDYFFYLAFENSFAPDYVSEELLIALQNNMVPVVFGGANYSRFLPPNSYIDAKEYTPSELADVMVQISHDVKRYSEFFKWKSHYIYDKSTDHNVCAICDAMNNKEMMGEHKSYDDFLAWWQPEHEQVCTFVSRFVDFFLYKLFFRGRF